MSMALGPVRPGPALAKARMGRAAGLFQKSSKIEFFLTWNDVFRYEQCKKRVFQKRPEGPVRAGPEWRFWRPGRAGPRQWRFFPVPFRTLTWNELAFIVSCYGSYIYIEIPIEAIGYQKNAIQARQQRENTI